MSFRLFLRVMMAETVLSALVFGAVLAYVDPTISGMPGFVLFYGSVFFFVSGLFVTILSWARGKTVEAKDLSETLGVSFRQGVFLGMLLSVILLLQSFQVLVWWVAVLTGVAFLFLEGVFLVRGSGK